MWEASDKELQLLNKLYSIRDALSDLDFEIIEVEGDIYRITEGKKDERAKILVFIGASFFLLLCVLAYFLCGNYSIALAFVAATGLGILSLVVVGATIFLFVRAMILYSTAKFWIQCGKLCKMDNAAVRKEQLQTYLISLRDKRDMLCNRQEECRQELDEEKEKNNNL